MWKRLECKFNLRVYRAAVWRGRGSGPRDREGGKRYKESLLRVNTSIGPVDMRFSVL